MISQLKSDLGRVVINSLPPRVGKKKFIIESDDWGAEVISSNKVYDDLIKSNKSVASDAYCKFDNIANYDDLSALFDVLNKYKDCKGNSPSITANVNMGNPDYDAIRSNDFDTYRYYDLEKTLQKHSIATDSLLNFWKEGMSNGVFVPQLHGREHLNVLPWLQALKASNSEILNAFNYNVSCVPVSFPVGNRRDFRAAFDFSEETEFSFHKEVLATSHSLFEQTFGFNSKSFIATCYTWSNAHEQVLNELGIRYLQGNYARKTPMGFGEPYSILKHRLGHKNKLGQKYLVRNVIFEPSLYGQQNSLVNRALRHIKIAFLLGKPATISMHRLNFIGSRIEKNRTDNLKLLSELLKRVLAKWPDVEFTSSDKVYD